MTTVAVDIGGATPLLAKMRAEGFTFRDLSYVTGKSASYLCRIANGQVTPPRATALVIAKALKTSPRELFPAL
jgi:transcriptional regulator with XRE-family HTH domain